MNYEVELVGKIGSMALIDKENNDIDYNLIKRLSKELKPGYVWVSSGATEIGRLDYIKRFGCELTGNYENIKTDYAACGQPILMSCYRKYISNKYSIKQVLVEHQHFNDEAKRRHLTDMLLRCKAQNAIPVINYNDAVSDEENRKMEISSLIKEKGKAVECVDNDETASQIACLLKSRLLVILTSVDGIYINPKDPSSLITKISGQNAGELISNIELHKGYCEGASRLGANGAKAKLEYIKEPVIAGTKVIIANAKYSLKEIISGKVRCTTVGIDN